MKTLVINNEFGGGYGDVAITLCIMTLASLKYFVALVSGNEAPEKGF